jgi:hypothetical protein
MSERISYNCILAAALVALSFVSNTQAASYLTFEQLADGRLSDAGIQEASGQNNSDPGPNASNPKRTRPRGKRLLSPIRLAYQIVVLWRAPPQLKACPSISLFG